jgi:hypothetical protein
LTVDASEVRAAMGDQHGWRRTEHSMTGLPQTLTYAESDFLPVVTTNTTRGHLNPLVFDWEDAPMGDVVVVNVQWKNNAVGVRNPVTWNAVLPPDSTSVTFPLFDDLLAIATSRPDNWDGQVLRTYFDSDRYDGFDALLSDGLNVEHASYAVPVLVAPTSTPVRTTFAYGCDCAYDHRRD